LDFDYGTQRLTNPLPDKSALWQQQVNKLQERLKQTPASDGAVETVLRQKEEDIARMNREMDAMREEFEATVQKHYDCEEELAQVKEALQTIRQQQEGGGEGGIGTGAGGLPSPAALLSSLTRDRPSAQSNRAPPRRRQHADRKSAPGPLRPTLLPSGSLSQSIGDPEPESVEEPTPQTPPTTGQSGMGMGMGMGRGGGFSISESFNAMELE
jgi:hypothetical protein